MNRRTCLAVVFALSLFAPLEGATPQKKILFDAMHGQTAGNADWTLDEDSCGLAQRFPTPDQAGITRFTPETYWSGGFSAMGVDLVKKGFHVESLPIGSRITYGEMRNAQDLRNYDVFVMPEPNIRLTTPEIIAIRNFVQHGGGLLMIADHAGSDRNNDGWDAAGIFNDMMGSPSVFGILFNDHAWDTALGRFDDHPDGNFTANTTSPIIYTGPFGRPSPSRGLGLYGSTSMTISGAARGHVWRTRSTRDSSTGVTFATSTYGSGRVAAVGDSSTAEDATNNCGHTTHLGYNDPQYDNGLILANAVAWLSNGATTNAPVPVTTTAPDSKSRETSSSSSTDVSGWTITQANATIVFTIPAGTSIPANGYLVIGRQATKAAFETFWSTSLGKSVVYIDGSGVFPQINGSENYTLKDATGATVDGPTISMASTANQDLQRKSPCLPASMRTSWNVLATTSANPGSGAAPGCAKSVVINEFSDAAGPGNYVYEFVELYAK
ncbi:MAG: hypothetical protein NVSMB68_04940 [Thermoanaerobaculia bacterium]